MRRRSKSRSGFTLVELMVSLALTVFMMAILSEAFVVGLESFRKLRALTELEQNMRMVEAILRRDLAANHFEGDKRLSECTVSGQRIPTFSDGTKVTPLPGNWPGGVVSLSPYQLSPPNLGFFSIREGVYNDGTGRLWPQNPNSTAATNLLYEFEGQETNGKWSWRDTNDALHFTVRLNGNNRDNFFTGKVFPGSVLDPASGWPNSGASESRYTSAGTLSSQWAEVVYFLAPVDQAVQQPPTKPAMFNLYRKQFLLLPDAFAAGTGIIPEFQQVARTQAGPNPPGTVPGAIITNPNAAITYYRNYDLSAFFYESALYPGGNNQFFFNSPADVQFRPRRYNHGNFPYPRFQDILPAADPRMGADLVLPNVLSFDIKVLDPIPTSSVDNFQLYSNLNSPAGAVTLPAGGLLGQPTSLGPAPPPSLNPNRFVDIGFGRNFWDPTANGGLGAWTNVGPFVGPGFNNGPGMGFVFDTWSTRNNGSNNPYMNYADQQTSGPPAFTPVGANVPTTTKIPYAYPFNAIQIKIRVWDRKTNQTRELTIVQEM